MVNSLKCRLQAFSDTVCNVESSVTELFEENLISILLCPLQFPYVVYSFSAVFRLCFPMYNTNKKNAKYCYDTVSVCAIFFRVSPNGLTLPVSVTMTAVFSVKTFYIGARMGRRKVAVSLLWYCW